jgi:vacuolar-type H+-ATPase subunit I/STV1
MQKVAVLAHKNRSEELIEFLQKEGVMEVTEARETTSNVDHSEVNFRVAEIDFAISTLKEVASKQQLAAMKKAESSATQQQILHASASVDVRGIIDALHKMDAEDQQLRQAISGPQSVVLGDQVSEQAAYLPESGTAQGRSSGAAIDVIPANVDTSQVTKAQKQLTDHAVARQQLAEQLPGLVMVRRYVKWLNTKQGAREAMKKTKTTVMLFGWLPLKMFAAFEKKLHKAIDCSAVLKVKPDAGEEPPVLLQNSKALTPFESVTTLYGLPLYREMDPTPYLSFFFILFFALCLTDAGYGLVLALFTGGYLLKTKTTTKENPLIWLLFLSGIVTFFVSIPFGGWFGIVPDNAPELFTKADPDGVGRLFKGQIWNLSDKSGITFLQNLSLGLGIVHLSFGILLGAISKIRTNGLADGLWKDGTTLVFIGTILLFFFGPAEYKQIFLYSIYASLAVMIWGKGYGNPALKRPMFGILQTLNFFLSMMGNVLSYLRILALGLVTGALAFTVNLVAEQISLLLPWFLAIPVALVIYVVGHLMNIALNVLGAFIHSGRLQFVEFFSQFFEGGGRPFRPFSRI